MSERDAVLHKEVLSEAAHWFALLQSGQASEQDQRRWQAWLGAADSPQSRAWRRVEQLSAQFQSAREPVARAALAVALPKSRQRLRRTLVLGGGVGAGVWLLAGSRVGQAWQADHHSAVGEITQWTLADGTQLWLNTDSAVQVRYTAQQRVVRLLYGELHVATASAATETRPFRVETQHGLLRALGTRYSVTVTEDQTRVSVYEGAVALQPSTALHELGQVAAGRQAWMSAKGIGGDVQADPARLAWTRGLLLANDVPLSAFVAVLARYRRGHLGCAPEVADLRVVGAFPAAAPDVALRMLEAALPVRVRQRSRWWLTIVPQATPTASR